MENGRYKVFNFQLSKPESNLINEKLDHVFEKLDCAAKLNMALGVVLRNTETAIIVISTLMKITHFSIKLYCFVLKLT